MAINEGKAKVEVRSDATANGRAVRNPLMSPAISKAMGADLARLGMSRSDFAQRLNKTKLQTVGWWFSNSAIPMNRIMDVTNLLGPESMTFEAVRSAAKKMLARDIPKRTRTRILETVRQLDGVAELNNFINENEKDYDTLNAMVDAFCEKYPIYTDVAKSRTAINTGGISQIPSYKTGSSLLAMKKRAGLGDTNYSSVRLYKYSKTEMDAVFAEIDEILGDGSEDQLRYNATGEYIRITKNDMIVGVIALPFVMQNEDDDPDDHEAIRAPFYTGIKAAAFEMYQAMQADKKKGLDHSALLIVYDRFSMITRRSYHETNGKNVKHKPTNTLIDEIRSMGMKFTWADGIDELLETIAEATGALDQLAPRPADMNPVNDFGLVFDDGGPADISLAEALRDEKRRDDWYEEQRLEETSYDPSDDDDIGKDDK